ncbi:MAG: hypothetical protein M3322_03850, partial [Actinomycetota bacterium]|nr:hypothetical protein [Actinomycetota bacterium]
AEELAAREGALDARMRRLDELERVVRTWRENAAPHERQLAAESAREVEPGSTFSEGLRRLASSKAPPDGG